MITAYRRLLHNRALTRLFVGEFVSAIGDWLYLVALLIVIYAESGDAVLLGIVGAARVVPYVILSVPAGIMADRYDRRMILLVSDLARGAIMILLAILVYSHGPLLAVVALAILATCFSAFFYPAIGALIPSLVTDESELGPANSAWASLDTLAFVVGPAFAGILVAVGDVVWAFILNAISFGFVAIVLWRLPRPARAATKAGATVTGAETATGAERPPGGEPAPSTLDLLRPVARPFAGVVLVNSAASFAFGGLSIATVVLAVDILKAGEGATGYLNAAIGVGGLIGALISGALVLRRSLAQPLLGGAVAFGLGLAVLGLVPNLGVALVAIGAAALGGLLVDVASATIFQRTIPDQIRGRALGVNHTIAIGASAVGAFGTPILLAGFGAGPVLVGLALAAVAGAIGGTLLIGAAAVQAPTARPEAMRLARLPIFAGLPTPRLDAAIAKVEIRVVHAGDVVIREGDPADHFYVIADGSFVVMQRDPESPAERRLRTLGADDVFGEIGLLTARPRTATVTAETDGTLLVLNGPDFLELVGSGSGLGSRLLGLYAPAGQGAGSAAVGASEG
jgi:MFS family permease